MKQEAIEQLFQIVEKQIQVYQSLCSILEEESAAMIGLDIKALAETTLTKETLISKAIELETIRQKKASEVALLFGSNQSSPSTSDLINLFNETSASRLRSLMDVLSIRVKQSSALNRENMTFAEGSLERIQFMKSNIFGAAGGREAYTAQGSKTPPQNSGGRLLSQEA